MIDSASDREEIFARLGGDAAAAPAHSTALAEEEAPSTADRESLLTAFARAFRANQGGIEIVDSRAAVPMAAAVYLRGREGGDGEIVCAPDAAGFDWAAAGLRVECRAPRASDAVGITGAQALVAATGSILVAPFDGGVSLRASLLPPTHLAVASIETLAPDLAAAFRGFAVADGADSRLLPDNLCLISGPSRTADIEQTLVLGAHGPLAVHLIVYRGGGGDDGRA